MVPSVAIIGSGQLGTRHLQGMLTGCALPLDIWVIDPNPQALKNAEQRIFECASAATMHIHMGTTLSTLPQHVNVVVVATNSDSRPEIVQQLRKHVSVDHLVLEKILASSVSDLHALCTWADFAGTAWVNHPRRMSQWHEKMRSMIAPQGIREVKVSGSDWGLVTNSLHFIDLLEWWTGQKVDSVDASQLSSEWHPSKRSGFVENSGLIEATWLNGPVLLLEDKKKKSSSNDGIVTIDVSTNTDSWSIIESLGVAQSMSGHRIMGKLKNQSDLSGDVVTLLVESGKVNLPTLEEAMSAHRIYIEALGNHWEQTSLTPLHRMRIT